MKEPPSEGRSRRLLLLKTVQARQAVQRALQFVQLRGALHEAVEARAVDLVEVLLCEAVERCAVDLVEVTLVGAERAAAANKDPKVK